MKSSLKITAISLIVLLTVACGDESKKETSVVYITDSSVQCEFLGNSPDITAQVLIDNGIDVIKSECGFYNHGVFAVCGSQTSQINLHTIHKENLVDADRLGYKSVAEITEGYTVAAECHREPR